jgi:hypothetical protein
MIQAGPLATCMQQPPAAEQHCHHAAVAHMLQSTPSFSLVLVCKGEAADTCCRAPRPALDTSSPFFLWFHELF